MDFVSNRSKTSHGKEEYLLLGKQMSKPNKSLVRFIKEARKRGFSDLESRAMMLKKGWPINEVEKAFISLQEKFKFKNQVCLYLNNDISKKLAKRAKKNLFTIPEQIEDILRRSCASKKRKGFIDNVDDKFLSFFSRRAR